MNRTCVGVFCYIPAPMQEEMNRGKPNWEHLNEDLHVLITVEDAQNRATMRLTKAADEVRKLLVPLVGTCSRITTSIIGPIPWGHSGPLCHALS